MFSENIHINEIKRNVKLNYLSYLCLSSLSNKNINFIYQLQKYKIPSYEQDYALTDLSLLLVLRENFYERGKVTLK